MSLETVVTDAVVTWDGASRSGGGAIDVRSDVYKKWYDEQRKRPLGMVIMSGKGGGS